MKKKMKLLKLTVDWSLWPRCEIGDLDITNVNRMREALSAGLELPPIIADRKSLRIVDGVHRRKAYLSVFGDDAEVIVDAREYADDGELYLDAVRLNARQGLPLSQKDKAAVFIRAKEMGLSISEIAEAIGMRPEKVQDFLERRSAKVAGGETIALPAGARHLAGKELNKEQEKFARHANGMAPIINARLLLNALKAGGLPITDKHLEVYIELRDLLTNVIDSISAEEVAA